MVKNYVIKAGLEPQEELYQAITNTSAANSYKYELNSEFTTKDRTEVISRIKGEKSAGNTHIKGEMVKTAIDIYFIAGTIYNYDSLDERWLVIDSETTNSEELLISELNPLSNFRFNETGTIEAAGFENVDGTDCLLIKCNPVMENELLETIWQDFVYQVWIDYKHNLIKKAALQAVNKQNNATKLSIEVKFSEVNENITINPPDISGN